MGFFRELFFGKDGAPREEKTERVYVEGNSERRLILDSRRRFKEERRWNPRTDRWDVLDDRGNVTGHVRRDPLGRDEHTDLFGNVTGYDRREGSRTVGHYDARGNRTGYTSRDHFNNHTRHTFGKKGKK